MTDLDRDHYRARYRGKKRPYAPKTTKAMGLGDVHIGANYSDEDLEFFKAVDRFKTETGRRFPTLGELLAVLKGLGWQRRK